MASKKETPSKRTDFQQIRQITAEEARELDKVRYDLQESIERTIRIKQAFDRKLTKLARKSNRIQATIARIEEIEFYGTIQRQIAGDKLSKIITLSEIANEKKRKRVQDKLFKIHRECNCYACMFPDYAAEEENEYHSEDYESN